MDNSALQNALMSRMIPGSPTGTPSIGAPSLGLPKMPAQSLMPGEPTFPQGPPLPSLPPQPPQGGGQPQFAPMPADFNFKPLSQGPGVGGGIGAPTQLPNLSSASGQAPSQPLLSQGPQQDGSAQQGSGRFFNFLRQLA